LKGVAEFELGIQLLLVNEHVDKPSDEWLLEWCTVRQKSYRCGTGDGVVGSQ
jgi:hypothetical protein